MRSVSRVLGIVFTLLLATAAFGEEAPTGAIVTFADPKLEEAVRAAIAKPTGVLRDTDLVGKNFTALNAANRGIESLSGIEYCKDLTLLQLYSNKISDLTPISTLTRLTDLYLWENQIQDISPLENLINLRRLFIHKNLITDIHTLVLNPGIDQGDVINVTGNNLIQDSICFDVPALTLRGVTITTSSVCGKVLVLFPDPNLEEQVRRSYRRQTGIVLPDDIYDENLRNEAFKTLYASNSGISDLSGIEYCVNLETVFLDGNQISDLTPLSPLGKLTTVSLGGNNISDLTPLSELYGIIYLQLENNNISNLAPLEKLHAMMELFLHHNAISSLASIAELYQLRSLTVGYQRDNEDNPTLSAVPEITEFTEIEKLDLSGNKISDLQPLHDLENLKLLNISDLADYDATGNKIPLLNNLSAIGKIYSLESLDSSNNSLLDVTPLANLQNLRYLFLHENKLTNVVSLAGLPKLSRVMLMNNQISDISPLVANTGLGTDLDDSFDLDRVDLRGNSLSQESLCEDIPALQARHVIVDYDGFCCDISDRFTLTTMTQGEGTVDPPGTRQFCWGSTMTLAANPEPGWQFDHWEGDLTGNQNPIDITIISNMRITAVFGDITKTYKILLSYGGSGSVQLSPPQPETGYSSGAQVTLTPVAEQGWVFDHWEGAVTGTTVPVVLTMDSDKEIGALFKRLGPIYKLTTAAGPGGTINPAPGEYSYEEGTVVPLEAIPDIGYVFDHWEGITGPNPTAITMTGHTTVKAIFRPDGYDHTLAMIVEGSGTTLPPAGYNRYYKDEEVTISATANTGWVFDHWAGDIAGEENPTVVVMDVDKTIRAVFIATVTYTLTTAVEGGGTVTPSPGAHMYAADKKVMLLAVPDQGWIFDHWEGDVGGIMNPYTVAMTEDISATAVFRPFPYILTVEPTSGYTTGNTAVTITGGNLGTTSRVLFDTVPAEITSQNDGAISVVTPVHERGVVDVAVETELGNVTKIGAFTYIEPPGPPQIDLVVPSQGSIVGANTVTIRGRNLAGATSVTFGDLEVEDIITSENTRLIVTAPLLTEIPDTLPYTVDVSITTGFGSDTCEGCFSYVQTPQIAAVYPSQGYIGGGDTVFITGVGFQDVYSVKFDGGEGDIVLHTNTKIEVVTPPHAAGIVDVTVTSDLGAGTLEDAFNYYSESATITCFLWDAATNDPVTDATVRIDPQTRIIEGSENGAYAFQHVRPGTYHVTIESGNCKPASQDVTVQQYEQASLNFQLDCPDNTPIRPCGINIGQMQQKISEETIPPNLQADPDGFISPTGEIAVRITVPGGIEPTSVWAVAEGQTWSCAGGYWRGDVADGWIVLNPEPPIPVGEVITVTVGAVRANGKNLDPISYDFAVGPASLAKSLAPVGQLVVEEEVEPLPAPVADSQSKVYRVMPRTVYEQPVTVQLPIPEGVSPDSCDLYYYSESIRRPGWYPADNVIGWLVPDSTSVVTVDGKSFLQFKAAHSAVVQVGKKINVKATAMDVEMSGSRGMWISLVALLTGLSLTLGLLAKRKAN